MKMNEYSFLLDDLLYELKKRGLLIHSDGVKDMYIESISYNSQNIGNRCLFICKGFNFKNEYLADAVSKGALCVLSEINYGFSTPYILVRDVRKALAIASSMFYRTNETGIKLIGVTGTKGKSTTVYFLHNILTAAGIKNGYSTTVNMFDGEKSVEAVLTTPESDVCHRNIRTAADNGCQYFIMETSSQAFKLDRIYGMKFDYGIFVNISPDHISPHEHRDFDDYFDCKLNIVKMFTHNVVNFDDSHFNKVASAATVDGHDLLKYSIENEEADIYATDLCKKGFKTVFNLNLPDESKFACEVNIPGVYNVSNALAAAGVAFLLGIKPEYISCGIAATQIPGRMEIFERNGYTVIVDYAHNETSMNSALKAIKDYYPGKEIRVVFGCPGGKALTRRKDMAYEASLMADYVYITSEDPGSEDPLTIANEVKSYLDGYKIRNEIITDRKDAVRTAIQQTAKNQILLITGKGSEHYQIIGNKAVPYEGDTVLAAEYINEFKIAEAL